MEQENGRAATPSDAGIVTISAVITEVVFFAREGAFPFYGIIPRPLVVRAILISTSIDCSVADVLTCIEVSRAIEIYSGIHLLFLFSLAQPLSFTQSMEKPTQTPC